MMRFSFLALALIVALLAMVSCESTTTGSSIGDTVRGVVDSITGGGKPEPAAHSTDGEGINLASVRDKVEEVKDGCVGAAGDMARCAKETVQGATETVRGKAEATKEAVAGQFAKASEGAKETVKGAKDTVKEEAEETREVVAEQVGKASDAISGEM
mmetsp:Transcript_56593/g.138913  ORF Transcript_56593/g.138913 Transcript_56593/m.138913 type:complete len:157 (-) Transcript_56593:536-1006(-)